VKKFAIIGLTLLLATSALVYAYQFWQDKVRREAEAQFDSCRFQVMTTAGKLKDYSDDHNGRYPVSLSELVPDYYRELPKCPAADRDTFSTPYQSNAVEVAEAMAKAEAGEVVEIPLDHYKFYCQGQFHTAYGLAPDLPGWDSETHRIEGQFPIFFVR
jgi:hypothetical protein